MYQNLLCILKRIHENNNLNKNKKYQYFFSPKNKKYLEHIKLKQCIVILATPNYTYRCLCI